ncbi:MAG: 30S ribosomal protein S20 [Candidatus Marinimicrobia bacterium]|nr:30S ribosomal protein S20 [Candidatus Neomarinimicrobiota bacterium]MCF7828171.1 30S ribosomal protein S20 [Candidatus Neomarinimicrobiota bacterium]MCF7879654.1 30S ribosomal protein S20 [Candidatus Neomarinimicrobiota bacterium]
MPITKSGKKRVRQAEKRRKHNLHYKTKVRSAVKKVMNASDKETAESLYQDAVSTIDKVASKGIIHKNKAAREKSKITKHVNSL